MIAAERTELLEFLRTLSDDDGLTPADHQRARFTATDLDWTAGASPEGSDVPPDLSLLRVQEKLVDI